jgi:hypothetical protein
MSERAGTVSEPSRCDCRWSEDCPEVPCGCGQEQVRLYRDEAYHWRGLHWRTPCLIAALAAPRPSADPALPPELREQTDQGDGLLGNTGMGTSTGPPSTTKDMEIPMTECGVCNGKGQVYISRPTCGPSGIELCINCQGTGHLLIAGSSTVAFKREDELPPVRFKTDAELHGPERWKADLVLAGWREVRLSVWARPDGALFRGPYGAWCALQGEHNALDEA